MCTSPELFAAYHVLRRLLVPRHPPCALCSFVISSLLIDEIEKLFLSNWFFSLFDVVLLSLTFLLRSKSKIRIYMQFSRCSADIIVC